MNIKLLVIFLILISSCNHNEEILQGTWKLNIRKTAEKRYELQHKEGSTKSESNNFLKDEISFLKKSNLYPYTTFDFNTGKVSLKKYLESKEKDKLKGEVKFFGDSLEFKFHNNNFNRYKVILKNDSTFELYGKEVSNIPTKAVWVMEKIKKSSL